MNHATYTAKVRMDRARAEWRRLERAVDAAKDAAGAARVAYHAAHLAFHSLKDGEPAAPPPGRSGTYRTDQGVGLPVEIEMEVVPWGRPPSPEEIKEDMNQFVAFVGDVPVYDDPEAWEAAGEPCEYCGGLGGNGGDDVCPACKGSGEQRPETWVEWVKNNTGKGGEDA